MRLGYNETADVFHLHVRRKEHNVRTLMVEHGLDFSDSASTPDEACLFTREPYAAASFAPYATAAAKRAMGVILPEIDASWKEESKANIACPADQELWPFQKADIEYALRRTNTLVADEPGLGKTPIGICYANEIQARRVLVIVPANIRLQWATKISQWTTMRWPYTIYPILTGKRGVHPTAEWTVVSYDLARNPNIGRALLAGDDYDLMICDEIHYLKTIDSQRTRAVFGDLATGTFRKWHEPVISVNDEGQASVEQDGYFEELFAALASKCHAIMGLTGTPLPNRPREAYVVARNFCHDSIDYMSEDNFKERFNPSAVVEGRRKDGTSYTYTREEAGRHGELQNRMRANFMTRHLKKDVMPQLKLPFYDTIVVEENKAIKQALQAEHMLDLDLETLRPEDMETMGHIAKVRHMMGLAMAPKVAEYIEMLYKGGEEKLCIFGYHIKVLDIIEQRLQKSAKVVRVDGRVSAAKKQTLVDQFINDPGTGFFLANMTSAGTGTDGLQEVCWHALFAECSWTMGENQQCVDRLHRMGQGWTVQADFFVAPGSISAKILNSAIGKLENTTKVLDRRM
jgi:hypothetical protein